jgi:1-pyrroline-5-carboxylate dehydrogenase
MPKGTFYIPDPVNEPVLSYAPGTAQRETLQKALQDAKKRKANIPMYIGGKEVRTKDRREIRPPHELGHVLGEFSQGDKTHTARAIKAAMAAKKDWANMPWEHRASIFLKAAELLAGPYRDRMNAATMLGQSKNAYQAEIDAACEYIDFLRFNAAFMQDIYGEQPESSPGIWNRMEYRPLEGFVLAVTPFNFTSIAGNLPCAPALMGNTVVWKPSSTQIYSAWVIVDLLREAGLPDGVINTVYASGPDVGDVAFADPDFAGIHFTGSTGTFNHMWRSIGSNIDRYKTYPRIVGETGGKDFVWAHPSADPEALAVALARGAFEYQGQKCSAASRAYIPSNLWNKVRDRLVADVESFKMGPVEDFSNFVNAVIDEKSFDNLKGYLTKAKRDKQKILVGGNASKKEGYYVEPTVIQVGKANYRTMCDELFGPVLSIYVYDEKKWRESLDIVDKTSPYALTGAIFSQDRYVIAEAAARLQQSAGNFYINDKPTGAVVGQQPFGGSRASGTNDKAGSSINLQRWVSPRVIKENFVPPKDYRYPFLG